jgi:hypothetical protein
MAVRRLASPVPAAGAFVPESVSAVPLPDVRESTPEFPGCRPVRIARDAIDDYEGRFEYWDSRTETAWVAREPTSVYHEGPSQQLAGLLTRIAAVRGAPIVTLGTADLVLRDAKGDRRRIMQADQMVYLDPVDTRPRGMYVEVGSDHLPDVVLEVDYATDVRRGKLGLYEAWGFPEVWVEVPAGGSPRRRPGLTIHRRAAGGYRTAPASVALPGWTAAEIHAALNEPVLSEATRVVLDRVGRALGAAGGTGPDDDPWLAAHRREGRAEGCADTCVEILRSCGLPVSERLAARIAGADPDALVAAALACRDEEDLLACLDAARRAGRRDR